MFGQRHGGAGSDRRVCGLGDGDRLDAVCRADPRLAPLAQRGDEVGDLGVVRTLLRRHRRQVVGVARGEHGVGAQRVVLGAVVAEAPLGTRHLDARAERHARSDPAAVDVTDDAAAVREHHVRRDGGGNAVVDRRRVLHCVDARDGTGEPDGLVDVVDHQVADDAPARAFGEEPRRLRGGAGTAEPLHGERADPPGVDAGLDLGVFAHVPHDVGREESYPGLFGGSGHGRRGFGRRCERLLADHVESPGDGALREVGVGAAGGHDVDDVDQPDEGVDVGHELESVLLGDLLRSDERGDVPLRPECPPGVGMHAGDAARADESDLQRAHCFSSVVSMTVSSAPAGSSGSGVMGGAGMSSMP